MASEKSNLGRRNFLQMTGAGIVAAGAGATATQALASNPSADSESSAGIVAPAVAGICSGSDDSRYHGRNPDRVGRDPLLWRGW